MLYLAHFPERKEEPPSCSLNQDFMTGFIVHHTWPPQRVTSCHTRVTSQQHKSSHKMDSKCTVLHSSTSLTSACFCLQLCLKVLARYACISAHFLTHCMCALCRDTAGQERFKTITTAYYRGAMVSTGCL